MALRVVLALSFAVAILAPAGASARRESSEHTIRASDEGGRRVKRERKRSKKNKRVARREVDHETDEAIAAHLREVTAGPAKHTSAAATATPPPPPEKPTMVTKAKATPRQRRVEPTYDRLVRLHGQIPRGD